MFGCTFSLESVWIYNNSFMVPSEQLSSILLYFIQTMHFSSASPPTSLLSCYSSLHIEVHNSTFQEPLHTILIWSLFPSQKRFLNENKRIQDTCHIQQQCNDMTYSPTCHTCRLSTSCALHSFCIQDWPLNLLSMHAHQHALHTQHYPTPCLPSPSYALTKGKMAQGVGMVWKCCGVIPILFG